MPARPVLKATAVNQNLLGAMETAADEAAGSAAAAASSANTAGNAANVATGARDTALTYRNESRTARDESRTYRDESRAARDQAQVYRDQAGSFRDQAQAAAAGINTANGSTALRSVLALGADVENQFRHGVGYLTATNAEQHDDGTWTLQEGGQLHLDIPAAPPEAYNVSFGFVVLKGDGRYITAQARADGSSAPPQVAVPAEGYYDGTPPQAFVCEASELDFGGRNLVVEIINPAGQGAIRISQPVLQWAPRLTVPFALSNAETRVYRIRRMGASMTLTPADSGKLIVIPSSTVGGGITITAPISLGEGFHCDLLNLSSVDVTIATTGGTVVGAGSTLSGPYRRAQLVRLGTQIVVTGDAK